MAISSDLFTVLVSVYIFCLQLMLGVPERALSVLHEAMEPVLAHGAVIDKGRAMLLAARCQVAVAGFGPNGQGHPGIISPQNSPTA